MIASVVAAWEQAMQPQQPEAVASPPTEDALEADIAQPVAVEVASPTAELPCVETTATTHEATEQHVPSFNVLQRHRRKAAKQARASRGTPVDARVADETATVDTGVTVALVDTPPTQQTQQTQQQTLVLLQVGCHSA